MTNACKASWDTNEYCTNQTITNWKKNCVLCECVHECTWHDSQWARVIMRCQTELVALDGWMSTSCSFTFTANIWHLQTFVIKSFWLVYDSSVITRQKHVRAQTGPNRNTGNQSHITCALDMQTNEWISQSIWNQTYVLAKNILGFEHKRLELTTWAALSGSVALPTENLKPQLVNHSQSLFALLLCWSSFPSACICSMVTSMGTGLPQCWPDPQLVCNSFVCLFLKLSSERCTTHSS